LAVIQYACLCARTVPVRRGAAVQRHTHLVVEVFVQGCSDDDVGVLIDLLADSIGLMAGDPVAIAFSKRAPAGLTSDEQGVLLLHSLRIAEENMRMLAAPTKH